MYRNDYARFRLDIVNFLEGERSRSMTAITALCYWYEPRIASHYPVRSHYAGTDLPTGHDNPLSDVWVLHEWKVR